MTDQARKADQFRSLHIPGKPLVLFNIWDVGSVKAVRRLVLRQSQRVVGRWLRQLP
jgi:2-methylisocitrate lyase-like PEP mutase family enzyme